LTEASGGAPPDLRDDPEDADPGLAGERTVMAWTRTSLAFAAVGIAIVKARPLVGLPILTIAVLVWLLGHLAGRPGWPGTRPARALLVTVAITSLALAALVITLIGPPGHGIRL
jgi:uncharacterized membrane protein YidH (DUF202 family)